jgi:poly(A) polymerase
MTAAATKAAALLDDPGLRRVLDLLDEDGEEARVVGGAVRNALMGRAISDYDIATTARPDIVVARAKAARIRSIPTGIEHGTITLLIEGRSFEVTTLREDVETDGRHAKTLFGRDFAQDARRRDFTINALSLSRDGTVHDYAGGLDDLAAGRVRFIGDAATRIREDYLRILRFFRFSADYAETLDDTGLSASIRERDGLARLSRERVRQEMLKLLAARRAVPVVAAMSEAGLLGPLLQSAPQPARLGRLVRIDPNADAILRLAALAVIVPEDAARLCEALRLSKAEAARLDLAAEARTRLHGIADAPPPRLLREILFDFGRSAACAGLMLAWTESGDAPDHSGWRSALRFLQDTPEPRLPFAAADLMARGVPAGRPLGEALKRLQANWIRAGFPQDPRSLAALLAEVAEG